MKHYETFDLVDYQRGLLEGEEAKELFAHCQTCRECGDRLSIVLALRAVGERRRTARRRVLRGAAAAVGAAVLVGVAIYSFSEHSTQRPVASVDTQPTRGSLAEYASTELPSRGFLVVRFRPGTPIANVEDAEPRLKAAVEELWAGNADSALPALRELWLERPNEERAAYMGIAMYLSGRSDAEVRAFLEMGTNTVWTPLSRYSTFYLANYHLRTGQNQEAYELLQSLTANDSPSTAAKRLLARLPIDPGMTLK